MGEERCVPAWCFLKAAGESREHPLAVPLWPGGAPRLPGFTPRPCRQLWRCRSSLGSQPGTMAALCSGRSRSTPGTRVSSGLRGPPLSLPGSRGASAVYPAPGGCGKSWWPRLDCVHCKQSVPVPIPTLGLWASSLLPGSAGCLGTAWPEPKPVLEHSRDPLSLQRCLKQAQGAVKKGTADSPLPSGLGVTGVSGREERGQGRWSRLGWFIPPPRRTSDARVMRSAGGARPQVDQRESWGNTAQAGDSRL